MTDPRFSSIDTFGVYVEGDHEVHLRRCAAICDTPIRVRYNVRALQERHRMGEKATRLRIAVDRLPRKGDPKKMNPTPCGYCGRSHWGLCKTCELGEPRPFEDGTPLPLPSEA